MAKTDADHVDDVVLATSELVTNALCHAVGEGTLSLGIVVQPRWTHLYGVDPDPTMPVVASSGGDDLALSGRGVPIVGELGLLWFVAGSHGKTADAVAQWVRTGVLPPQVRTRAATAATAGRTSARSSKGWLTTVQNGNGSSRRGLAQKGPSLATYRAARVEGGPLVPSRSASSR